MLPKIAVICSECLNVSGVELSHSPYVTNDLNKLSLVAAGEQMESLMFRLSYYTLTCSFLQRQLESTLVKSLRNVAAGYLRRYMQIFVIQLVRKIGPRFLARSFLLQWETFPVVQLPKIDERPEVIFGGNSQCISWKCA